MSLPAIITALSPELVLLVGACVVLMLGLVGAPPRGRLVAPATLIAVAAALLLALLVDAPANAEIVPGLWISTLAVYSRWIALSIGMLIVLVNWAQPIEAERGEYMAMILFSLLGILLTAEANDLVVLFFAIELVSVPTYVLIALSREDARASEASVKYFFLGALAAAILAFGTAYLYGAAGTTALTVLRDGHAVSNFGFTGELPPHAVIGLLLVFAGLAFKIAAVPLHVYVGDVYEGAAAPVTGMLGFAPKFAGFVALVRIFGAFDWNLGEHMAWMLWIVAAATMTVGNVLALLQRNVKRLLAYSSVAHTGYMLIALLVGPVAGMGPLNDGIAALLFYVVVYGAMNLGAFALLSAFRADGREIETIEDLNGLAARSPAAALAFAICVFSLMGIPPTAGFLGKVYIFSSAFSVGPAHPMYGPLIVLAVIAVVNTAIGGAYYLRLVAAAYMGAESVGRVPVGGQPIRWGLALCAIPLVVLFASPALLSSRAKDATIVLQQTTPRTQAAAVLAATGKAEGDGGRDGSQHQAAQLRAIP